MERAVSVPETRIATVPEGSRLLSRELSWLAFNERVLEEAADPRWPLLERVKFLAIFYSNLDEFFMIRVAGLHTLLEQGEDGPGPDGLTAREQLDRIGIAVRRLVRSASALLSGELLPALEKAGIRLHRRGTLDAEARARTADYFHSTVFPVLTPLAVDPGHPFPFISNLSLSLAVEAEDPLTGERRFARVKVPEILPRFVPVGGDDFIPLEDLIESHLDALFPGMRIVGVYPFRITRDMDMAILEAEADDLLQVVDRQVRRRRFGHVVRLELDSQTPERIRALLLDKLQLGRDDLYECCAPLGASALMALAGLQRPDLHDPPLQLAVARELVEGDVFATIRAGDVLLHHPYDSFAPVLAFLRRAAADPEVLAIKMTLYRTGASSDISKSLTTAAENGKQVAVAIELKARFDERNNIEWARALERAGVHVFYGSADLKIHAKAALVVRREGDRIRRYVHLSTGNYNAATSRIYTDVGLLSCAEEIGEDVSELFNALSGFARPTYRELAVAPETLAPRLLALIGEQAERARAGKQARIFAKMNALVDVEVIEALYAASQAGAQIDLEVRGICCLRPGVKGLSETIRVFSVVGRFLEHSRVFVFGPEGDEQVFLSSADWMPRNLQRRVELMFPVRHPELRLRLRRELVEPALSDNCRARDLDASGAYRRRTPAPGELERDAQHAVVAAVQRRAVHTAPPSGRRSRRT